MKVSLAPPFAYLTADGGGEKHTEARQDKTNVKERNPLLTRETRGWEHRDKTKRPLRPIFAFFFDLQVTLMG